LETSEFEVFSPSVDINLRIGICIEEVRPEIVESLLQNSNLCSLKVFSRSFINGLDCYVSNNPSEEMIKAFLRGEVDSFIRGVNDDFTFQNSMRKFLGCSTIVRLAIFRDVYQRIFAFGPVSAAEAKNKDERKEYALYCCNLLCRFGITPKVMVMAACRSGSKELTTDNKNSWNEAEEIVAYLNKNGFYAENVGIELDIAVEKGNMILPVSGLVGNQVYRSLVFLGKGDVIAVPAFPATSDTLSLCYEDNSRNENDYSQHIRAAMAISTVRKNEPLNEKCQLNRGRINI